MVNIEIEEDKVLCGYRVGSGSGWIFLFLREEDINGAWLYVCGRSLFATLSPRARPPKKKMWLISCPCST